MICFSELCASPQAKGKNAARETLNKSRFVIPAQAGIQESQRTGFRRPREWQLIQCFLKAKNALSELEARVI
jgi:hypothetical protein